MARCLVVLAILCELAFGGSASAAASAGVANAKCGPAAGKTLAHSGQGRVYLQNHSIYGCVRGSKPPVQIGTDGFCPGSAHLGPFAVAGKVAAYASRTCGVDTASAQVIVRRLSDGRQLSSHSATDLSPGVESFQSVGSIVVRSGGAVGWIGSSSSIATHRSITEVFEQSDGSVHRLDRGSEIRAGSLRLRDSKLTWQHGAEQRSATLS